MDLRRHGGFSLVELLAVAAIVAILGGLATPMVLAGLRNSRLNSAARSVQAELQRARLLAVTTNGPMRVRFNCPSTGMFRMVELIGTPALPDTQDSSSSRCSEVSYPYPPTTRNPLVRPQNDGPVRRLQPEVTFVSTKTIEFWPDGSAHADAGSGNPWPPIPLAGVTISVQYKTTTKSITVNGLGKIQLQ